MLKLSEMFVFLTNALCEMARNGCRKDDKSTAGVGGGVSKSKLEGYPLSPMVARKNALGLYWLIDLGNIIQNLG